MTKSFVRNLVVSGALSALATTASFAQAAPTLASAQKAYVEGKWKDAAAAYEVVCPTQPDSTRTECFLWNILALSQTGVSADFSKAGKRLDSLIETTNPQKAIYADLMMTKAQFLMYLGRYNKAAESLVQAIETSQPHQIDVLKKVCPVIQERARSNELNEACKNLGKPQAKKTVSTAQAATSEQNPSEVKTAPTPATTAAQTPDAKPAEAGSAWQLQLGAFGVKSNADLLVDNLKKRNISCTITQNTLESGKILYIVRTGPFETKENAVDYGAKKLAPLNVEFKPMLVKQAL